LDGGAGEGLMLKDTRFLASLFSICRMPFV
jgi:hypothetical protein